MYGTVTRKAGRRRAESFVWSVACEPHVTIRLKRVFSKIDSRSQGEHMLSDTPENARDLAWFLERYPMHVSHPGYLEAQAAAHREREALIHRLNTGRQSPMAFDLALPPREYQRIAATMLLEARGLLLADDVGLGKTVSAICCLADPRTLPVAVVTLTHLPLQWKAEIARFAPHLRVHICKQGTPYDMTRGGKDPAPDVILLGYAKLSGWAQTLAQYVRMVVYDEVQELRIAGTQKYAGAAHLSENANFRLGLSATPIYNYGGEIHTVVDVIRPGALGTASEFEREWCAGSWMDKKAKLRNPIAFGQHLRDEGLMLRRTRADVGRELPPLTKIIHDVEWDAETLDQVGADCADLARVILRQGESVKGEKFRAAEEFSMLLRQATGIAKAPYVAEFVRMLVDNGEKVVLFGWHRAVYEIWMRRLADLLPVLYTGSESATQKDASRKAFTEGDSKVLILSLRSGAGLDGLQHVCRTVVSGELDWSSGVLEQNAGRVHRDGQKDPVTVFYLIADGGCDPYMVDVLGLKAQQLEGLRNPNGALFEMRSGGDESGDRVKGLAAAYLAKRGIK